MVPARLIVPLLLLVAAAGGVAGAAAYALLFEDGTQQGEVLRLSGDAEGYHDIENTPFCVPLQHFCLVVLETGELRALYTYDTHDPSRVRSCEIDWRPDMLFTDPATQEESLGWFRAGCSGTTYRYNGERVFGPGGRDMDRYPATLETETLEGPDGEPHEVEYLEVDTRRLVCGKVGNPTIPRGCEKAPAPQ